MRHMLIAALLLSLTAGGALAQDEAQRPMQRGIKTVPAMWVAFDGQASPMNELDGDIESAITALWPTCLDNGFHPSGIQIVTVSMAGDPEMGDELQWEAWLPVIEQPGEDDLEEDALLPLKNVPATPVAFTYYVGDTIGLPEAIMDLTGWMMAEGLEPAGTVRTVFAMSGHRGPDGSVVEIQVEIAKPAE